MAGWAGTWASLSVSREHCFPSAHFLLASLFWNLKVPHGQKLAVAGFRLSGYLPCATPLCEWVCLLLGLWHQRCVFLLSPGSPWFQPCETTGKGGTPVSAPLKFTKLSCCRSEAMVSGLGGGGRMLKPVVNSAKINQPFKSCTLRRVCGQAGPFSCSPCSKSSRARGGLDGGKGRGNCVCVFLI